MRPLYKQRVCESGRQMRSRFCIHIFLDVARFVLTNFERNLFFMETGKNAKAFLPGKLGHKNNKVT